MKIHRMIKKAIGFEEIFSVAVRRNGEDVFHALPKSKDFWYADPLPVVSEGKTYVFMELFDRKKAKGSIAFSSCDDGVLSPPRPIIEEPFHMSFPFVFKRNDSWFMLPETSEVHQLRFYRAVEFPVTWELYQVMDGHSCVDSILTSWKKKQVVLLNEVNPRDSRVIRRVIREIAYDREQGFALGPVLAEDREFLQNTRTAGPVFTRGDKSFIPLQVSFYDGDFSYGHSVAIVPFDEHFPAAHATEEILPEDIRTDDGRKVDGLHTYCKTGEYEVIDIRCDDYNFLKYYHRLRARMRRAKRS